jgi:hypothetical protein
VEYFKISFPAQIFRRFMSVCRALGYSKRGERWTLLAFLLDYAEKNEYLFRKR